ncbi:MULTISPECIES: solute carrier family 23 protein [Sphaerochaeta]|jgi:uracil permease|uniref:Uracil permease n=1 Tax=bioreactor metagenome TaxID=1076179 RepID=A0A644WQM7_9ZZZZ|nr:MULTISPECIES: solute carrier family 23 protein [Sphaerochaeta]MDT3358410.1 NCS2 family nucleobase:cation symporter [Spirochaetota bacterium]MDD2394130.1 solute carrier family 23 protein [Sphaerochaeta sp.]MDD3424167.1 solute carrier family 23 protein [Sphaerochaeta sp.]MDD3456769.1 solute carrier family 23 protein [Sphaerochaeta sp.]MDD4037719.1 solute carrier family 23 protein [Sphaerochaeta sp.]
MANHPSSFVKYGPADKPPLGQWIPLSIQHVFAMFGATILVPILTGLSPSTALFTAGTGTLLYILITGAKVPAFLGSSFAFIPALIAISSSYGVAYAMGGAFVSGLFYTLVAFIIKKAGYSWLNKALPPVVIGSVIVVIGLNLAPTAMGMAMNDANGNYSLFLLTIAAVTLTLTIVANIFSKGFFSIIPILLGLLGGYFFALIIGLIFPQYALISFAAVKDAAWFGLPTFALPKFNVVAAVTFIVVSLATICEHLGDTLTISKVVGKDFYKDPGLDRTIAGDGLATLWASFWGGPPNTTYGENIGVLALTRVYSVWVTGGAAVVAIFLSFFPKFGALIQTIPNPVLGGISMLLFGTIASSGLRTLVDAGVNYEDKRNLTISSVILVIGIGGGTLSFAMGKNLTFSLAGVALATLVGILLNLVLPKTKE